ncbi:shikimate kinase [Luteococcus sp. Sow4_B9]|uniref:shikimate kinase n=1 Tax=Luteococcus sp. Sow4_B9 TaxID=3438792 RepID=UPI003F9BD91E
MTDPVPDTIVLVGAPGAGKSTVGKRLARALGTDFVDVDALVEERTGMPISEIFLTQGEAAFRELERDLTLECLQRPGVVSLGGGAVMDDTTRSALRDRFVIWLKVSAQQASRRVGLTGNDRPLLATNVHSTMVKLMRQRQPLYAEVATLELDTDGMKPAAVVRELLPRFGLDAGVPDGLDVEEE